MTKLISRVAKGLRRQPRSWGPCRVLVLILLAVLLPARGWAAAYGSVSGIVRDDSNQAIAGAKVVLQSDAHVVVEQQADATGRFDFPKVAIGHYTLTVSQHDFASRTESVTVEAGYFPFAQVVLPSMLAEVTVTAAA